MILEDKVGTLVKSIDCRLQLFSQSTIQFVNLIFNQQPSHLFPRIDSHL